MYYNELKQFIKNKPEVSDELYESLNKIERFTANAAIKSKISNKLNTFFYLLT